MSSFLNRNFLLENKTARSLYFNYADKAPIFDYHCHLNPQEIAQNKRFGNISELWLANDHYKWRAIRANGMSEQGDDPLEKFIVWASTVERLVGNPLYHWTHLELQRFFGIDEPLCAANARAVYEECNRQLNKREDMSVFGIFNNFNVYAVGTTDDPSSSLEYHISVKGKTDTKVLPSFRPDKALNIDCSGFAEYVKLLGAENINDLLQILEKKLDFFIECGCKASDHSLTTVPFENIKEKDVSVVFDKAMEGKKITAKEAEGYKTFMLLNLARLYAKRGIVMQLHFAAARNNNSVMYEKLGPDTGYDAIGNSIDILKLASLFDTLEKDGLLPKTVLYSLNPSDYYKLGALMGCFQNTPRGKMQLGSAWWFNDNKDGIETQLSALGNLGILSNFIGMLTDSRSFLSYPRHEYFRRILCNMLGKMAESGEIPSNKKYLGKIVEDICFNNAVEYFEGRLR